MTDFSKLYINGQWVASTGTDTIDVINSATEDLMASIPSGTASDVDRAVAAARAAFETWSVTTAHDRTKFVQGIAQGLAARNGELAALMAGEVGMPLKLSAQVQAGLPATVAASYVDILSNFAFEETIGSSLIVREAIGVVGCITPWNYPLHQIVAKVIPALAAGCTVVVKPSEVAPLNAFVLAEICDEVGLPAGVFNLVTGTGPVVGEALALHPDVDMISFTGSTRAGKRVTELAAGTVKRVALELGGKSANVVLPDADFAKAIPAALGACFLNSGQTCTAKTRLLVPRDRHDEVVDILVANIDGWAVGDPMTDGVRLGPLVSASQQQRVRGFIEIGIAEGATLVAGGAEQPEGLDTGFYVKATVFANVTNDMTIAQEEIFGPVLVVIPYDTEDDAVAIANDTPYGLSGQVWSGDVEHAKAVARRIRTGQVSINGGSFNPIAPFGGYKQSGNGRELGHAGLEEFLETKSMLL